MKERTKDISIVVILVCFFLLILLSNFGVKERLDNIEKAIANSQVVLKKTITKQSKEIAQIKSLSELRGRMLIEYKEYLDTIVLNSVMLKNKEVIEK